MQIKFHSQFDPINGQEKSEVFEVFPNVFSDGRGSFTEVLKKQESRENVPSWFASLSWIAQVNRSTSVGKVIRGCHAQKAQWCQAKLVQALTAKIYDIITDARPDSQTFGTTEVVLLDPIKQNQLFVPRGFLHAFATVSTGKESIFEYFCDNTYCKDSEIRVNPMTLLPEVAKSCAEMLAEDEEQFNYLADFVQLFQEEPAFNLSEKDTKAPSYSDWMQKVKDEYRQNGKLWYNA